METNVVLIAQLVWKHNKMSVNGASYLALPLLQHCAHVSLLCVGPCCVSQTVGLQGVGTCMQHTQKYSFICIISYLFFFEKKRSLLSTIRICSHLLSRRVNTSIDRVRSGVRGHMGSGVTETNCSEEEEPCNDPVGGFISATRANNKHFDPYTRTPTPWIIIQSIHTAGVKWRKTNIVKRATF